MSKALTILRRLRDDFVQATGARDVSQLAEHHQRTLAQALREQAESDLLMEKDEHAFLTQVAKTLSDSAGEGLMKGLPRPGALKAAFFPATKRQDPPPSGAVERFQKALGFKTVSSLGSDQSQPEMNRFKAFLRAQFPLVFAHVDTNVGDSLLFRLQGEDPELKPFALLAHFDVVAADESAWMLPAFPQSPVSQSAIVGRGAVDAKGQLMAILEAAEETLRAGRAPARTVYLAFGHDEELGGANGAKRIASHLKAEGLAFEAIIDEGGLNVAADLSPSGKAFAMVGIQERGYVSFVLRVRGHAGHSSTPPDADSSVISRLAQAQERLDGAPWPVQVGETVDKMTDALGVPGGIGEYLAPSVKEALIGVADSVGLLPAEKRAMFYTTAAPTVIRAGDKDNVMPASGELIVNVRLAPGESIEHARAHVLEAINRDDDPLRCTVEVLDPSAAREASPATSTESSGYRLVSDYIHEVFGLPVVPSLVLGGTDASHYARAGLGPVINFSPQTFDARIKATMHGPNEQMSKEAYATMIAFYRGLLRR